MTGYVDTSVLLRLMLREAGALVWRDRMSTALILATHDSALGLAAQAFGFDVRGI